VTVADDDSDKYETVTVQVIVEDRDRMSRYDFDVMERLKSMFWQLQSKANPGCSLAA
jgi:hypothetical protein